MSAEEQVTANQAMTGRAEARRATPGATLASIVICVRDDPRIEQCLTALFGPGADGFDAPFEVIVVENHDQPRLGWLADRFPIRYSVESTIGMHRARQRGVEMAIGDLVVCTDADCIPQSGWLAEIVRPLVDDPDVQVVAGRIEKIAPTSWVEALQPELGSGQSTFQYLPRISALPYAVTANASFRRNRLVEVGGLDPEFISGGDVDLSWRVLAAGGTMALANDALTHHACRPTLRSVYRQYRTYSSGHALLFRKHRGRGAWFCIDPYPIRLAFRAIGDMAIDTVRPTAHRSRRAAVQRAMLRLTEAVALVDGAARGSIRHRVLYL
jgi:GT2 family glycosyltransferase